MWHQAHSGIEKSAMAFEETASKGRKKMRNRQRLGLLGDGHKTGSGTQGAKQGNQWFFGTLD